MIQIDHGRAFDPLVQVVGNIEGKTGGNGVRALTHKGICKGGLIMKNVLLTAVLAVALIGCGGKAYLTIRNNTDRYVNGDVEGDSYGIYPSGMTERTVDVGGFLSVSSDVEITANIHCSEKSYSPVVERRRERLEMEKNHSYTYELFYSSLSGKYGLRLLKIDSNSRILAP